MIIERTTVKRAFLRALLCCCVLLPFSPGCIPATKAPHSSSPRAAAKPRPKPVDAEAQQRWYDLGLRNYSQENYGEAQHAFQAVVENGPNTLLGQKAQENLKKIEQILKTLKEIESR